MVWIPRLLHWKLTWEAIILIVSWRSYLTILKLRRSHVLAWCWNFQSSGCCDGSTLTRVNSPLSIGWGSSLGLARVGVVARGWSFGTWWFSIGFNCHHTSTSFLAVTFIIATFICDLLIDLSENFLESRSSNRLLGVAHASLVSDWRCCLHLLGLSHVEVRNLLGFSLINFG